MADSVRNETIAVVGLGNMGGAIARSMVREGFNLLAYDIRKEAVDNLVALGATAASSLDEVAEKARVISIVVVSDDQVKDVGGELVAKAKPGTDIMIHSTIRPSTVTDLAEEGTKRGINVFDCAVNGGSEKAELGTLTLMVGGPKESVEYCWPLFEAFGQKNKIFHVGPVGSGVVGKLVNNLIALGAYALQLEAMELGAAYGLDEDTIATIVIASQGDSRGMRMWGRADRRRKARAAQGTEWAWRMGRDLEEAAVAGGVREVQMPLTSSAAEMLPYKIKKRDTYLEANPPAPIPLCTICNMELAPPFREVGSHPECREDGA